VAGKFEHLGQQVSGGDSRTDTKGAGQNCSRTGRPMVNTFAYRSEAGEGGLFIVPATGERGRGVWKRMVAYFGFHPHWSRQLADYCPD